MDFENYEVLESKSEHNVQINSVNYTINVTVNYHTDQSPQLPQLPRARAYSLEEIKLLRASLDRPYKPTDNQNSSFRQMDAEYMKYLGALNKHGLVKQKTVISESSADGNTHPAVRYVINLFRKVVGV